MKKLFFTAAFFTFLFVPISYIKAGVPIKILLVPGHDDEVWGAQYGNTKEADMNLAVASRIYNILKKDKRFRVYITRDKGGYTKDFTDYLLARKDAIMEFRRNAKEIMQGKITGGDFVEKENIPHNTVSENIAFRLYGFNKWANDNEMDAVVHIHFNDYPRPDKWTVGKYKGFAIYFPDGQLANWRESALLATDIFTQLRKKYITSTYEKELGGLISDQKLIALGANGTLSPGVRSVLVEYGYIYRFRNNANRQNHYINMANLTARGIKNYFFGK